MAESIQCYQCGTRMTLEELASNDGDCPECDVEIHLAEYLSKALADIAVLRAQQSSQGGEAVEVIHAADLNLEAAFKKADEEKRLASCARDIFYFSLIKCIQTNEPLMTVAQHNRIMAAAAPAGRRVVPVELLERLAISSDCYDPTQSAAVEELRALLEVKP